MLNENDRAKYEEKIIQLENIITKANNDASSAKAEYEEKLKTLEDLNAVANRQLQDLSTNIEKLTNANIALKKVIEQSGKRDNKGERLESKARLVICCPRNSYSKAVNAGGNKRAKTVITKDN